MDMGHFQEVSDLINFEIKDFYAQSKRKIGKNILKNPNTVWQNIEEDGNYRLSKFIGKLESKPELSEKFRVLMLRLFKKASKAKNIEFFLDAFPVRTTKLSEFLEANFRYNDEKMFAFLKSFASGADKERLYYKFDIEFFRVKDLKSKGEARLFSLCGHISQMYEIFYKYYVKVLERCGNLEKAKANLLYNDEVKHIRNAASHNSLKYIYLEKVIEIDAKGQTRRYDSADLLRVIEHIRTARTDFHSLYYESLFSRQMLRAIFHSVLREMNQILTN